MKKSTFWILALMLLLVLTLAACDQTDPPAGDGTTDVPQTEAHVHAFGDWTTVKDATCTEKGQKQRTCACGEMEKADIDALGHTEVVDAAIAPTCAETGLGEGKHCSVCNEILAAQAVLDALGHTEASVPALDPTCTEAGYTEQKYCEVCALVITEKQDLPALGHTEAIDAAIAPTCTQTGLSEGKHCSVCEAVLAAQEQIAATGHTEEIDPGVEPGCLTTGLSEGKHCSVCPEVLIEQEVLPVLGHVEVVDEAVVPTCAEVGYTEGSHCSACGEVFSAQVELPALGHREVIDAALAPDCTNTGLTEGSHCTTCGEVLVVQEEIAALGHTIEILPGIPGNCQTPGLTEGQKCTACGEVLVEQEQTFTSGHEVDWICDSYAHYGNCNHCSEYFYASHTPTDGICSACGYDMTVIHVSRDEVDYWAGNTCLSAAFTPGLFDSWDQIASLPAGTEFVRVWGWVAFGLENPGLYGYSIDGGEVVYDEAFTVEAEDAVIGMAQSIGGLSVSRYQVFVPVSGLADSHTIDIYTQSAFGSEYVIVTFEVENHAYMATVTEPTCTQNGYTTYVCECGASYVGNEVEALGHTEEIDAAVPPTQTENGLSEGVHCSVCKEILVAQQVIPMLGYYSDLSLYSDDYGYTYLGTLEQGDSMQTLYELLDKAAVAFHVSADVDAVDNVVDTIDFAALGLDAEQAVAVWMTYKNDHPLYYWISTTVSYTDSALILLTESEYASGADRAAYNELIYAAVEDYLTGLSGQSNYRKALSLHDAIIYAIDYAYQEDGQTPEDAIWAHNILGVLDKQSGVCESYARTFQLLLNCLDVENVLVTGQSMGENHAWNLVQMDDGNWYWFDLTWDDTPDWMWGVSYNYFCVTDYEEVSWQDGGWEAEYATFMDTHTPSAPTNTGIEFLYELPERSDTEYDGDDLTLRSVFSLDDIEYAVVGYNAVAMIYSTIEGDLVIPEKVLYNGAYYDVIAIGSMQDGLFDTDCVVWQASTVTVPASVRFIWDNAFRDYAVESILVDENNEYFASVDGVLFDKSMQTLIQYPLGSGNLEYVIPDSVKDVATYAFGAEDGWLNLEKLTVGAGLEAFGANHWGFGYGQTHYTGGAFAAAFGNLSGAKELVIDRRNPNYVQVDGAVYNTDMTWLYLITDLYGSSYHMPASVAEIDATYAFDLLHYLSEITVDAENASFFAKSGVLYKKEGDSISICYAPVCLSGDLVLADGITEISEFAFYGCSNLSSVTVPEGVTHIGSSAFYYCSGLVYVALPKSLTDIGDYAFYECYNLMDVCYLGTAEEWEAVNQGYECVPYGCFMHYGTSTPGSAGPENENDPWFVLDANTLYEAATGMTGGVVTNQVLAAELRGDGKYVSIVGAGEDVYFSTFSTDGKLRSGRYLVMKYRTTEDCDGEFFLGSTGLWSGMGDCVGLDYTSDGEWHLLALDLEEVGSVNSAYLLRYLRVDCFTDGTNRMLDIGYIASFGSLDAAMAYDALQGYENVAYDAAKPGL